MLFCYGEGEDADADGGADVETVVGVVAEGTEDGEGAGGGGGSGGDDVVDDEDVFALEAFGMGAAEDALYVSLTLFVGEVGLTFVVDDATDGAGEDRQVGHLTDAAGDAVALVVAATELATPMEGDGDDAVDVGEERGGVTDFLCRKATEVFTEGCVAVVFEDVDDALEAFGVFHECRSTDDGYLAPVAFLQTAMLVHVVEGAGQVHEAMDAEVLFAPVEDCSAYCTMAREEKVEDIEQPHPIPLQGRGGSPSGLGALTFYHFTSSLTSFSYYSSCLSFLSVSCLGRLYRRQDGWLCCLCRR